MSNRHASKQHGLVGNIRPKSKLAKRANKARSNSRKAERVVQFNQILNQAAEKISATK